MKTPNPNSFRKFPTSKRISTVNLFLHNETGNNNNKQTNNSLIPKVRKKIMKKNVDLGNF